MQGVSIGRVFGFDLLIFGAEIELSSLLHHRDDFVFAVGLCDRHVDLSALAVLCGVSSFKDPSGRLPIVGRLVRDPLEKDRLTVGDRFEDVFVELGVLIPPCQDRRPVYSVKLGGAFESNPDADRLDDAVKCRLILLCPSARLSRARHRFFLILFRHHLDPVESPFVSPFFSRAF